MSRARVVLAGGGLFGLASLASCGSADAFGCKSDAECRDGQRSGVCQPSQYCSFDDSDCGSGQRYGAAAGAGLADSCVPVGDGTTGQPTEATTSSSGTTSLPPMREAESGNVAPVTSGSSETGASTTTGPSPACPDIVDDFEDGVISQDLTLSHPESITEAGGQLRFEITRPIGPTVRATYGEVVDFRSASLTLEPGKTPTSGATLLFAQVRVDDAFFAILFEGSLLVAHRGSGELFEDDAVAPFDPVEHANVRLRVEQPTVFVEVSPDGVRWNEFYSRETSIDFSAATIELLAVNYLALDVAESVSLNAISAVCNDPR